MGRNKKIEKTKEEEAYEEDLDLYDEELDDEDYRDDFDDE